MVNNKKKASLFILLPIIFFSVSGGPYGLEEIVSSVGPLYTLLLILILPIIWTIPETMIVAELSSSYPVQGGYYRWVEMSLGKFWGFMEGWWSILYTIIDLSLYPILFTAYLKFFFPEINFWQAYTVQLIVIWSSAILNIFGIRIVGYFLTLFQLIILIFFIIFILLGMKNISFDFTSMFNIQPKISNSDLLFGLSLAFWNFIGWDNGTTILDEVHNPKVNYHKALFISIPIIVFFYFFPLLVGLNIHTDWQNWRFGEFSFIANSMHYPLIAQALAVGGMVTCLGLFNSLLLSSTRIFSTMAEDKLLPDMFARIHKNYRTPHVAIIFLAIVYSLLVLVGFHKLVIYDVFLYLVAMFLEAIALIVLRERNPNVQTNFKIPFGKIGIYSIVAVACLIIVVMVLINLLNLTGSVHGSLLSLFLLLNGIPFYLLFNNNNKK